jgi:hypothetical protein
MTVGVDLGDVWSHYRTLDGGGRASFIWMVGNSSRNLFLKALTERLPMTRPRAVDICRLTMLR